MPSQSPPFADLREILAVSYEMVILTIFAYLYPGFLGFASFMTIVRSIAVSMNLKFEFDTS